MKFILTKTKKDKRKWHKWFAWYPIKVIEDGVEYLVWFESVERIIVLEYYPFELITKKVKKYKLIQPELYY